MSEEKTELETCVKRGAFGREVRPIGKPITHAEDAAATLMENQTLVRVRPFHKVPSSRSFLTTVRFPFTYEGHVVGITAGTMVTVRMVRLPGLRAVVG
ncbi:hypothetical protein JK364_23685 [Streptomyces sp. 110]|uniref:Uncharacterized protein n=1 Tax=Streptomyces endocoffeicus TaxID=2898945 RepID=A0ABS1PUH5_9ACTN|nr:hypothetical protein [Streptomyces endocoffeicus]MBL1115376.1 hypothetical protein [Streptomyces endocoffeicus]